MPFSSSWLGWASSLLSCKPAHDCCGGWWTCAKAMWGGGWWELLLGHPRGCCTQCWSGNSHWAPSKRAVPPTSQNFEFLSLTCIVKASLKLFLLVLEGFEIQLHKPQNTRALCAAGVQGRLCRVLWPVWAHTVNQPCAPACCQNEISASTKEHS